MPRFLNSLSAVALAAFLPVSGSAAQSWTDEQLAAFCTDFQSDTLAVRLEQVGRLLSEMDNAYGAMCARIHGDHREYLLKIESLLDKLADERWTVREEAERTLIEVGARARGMIEQRAAQFDVLEQSVRAARILRRIDDRDLADEERQIKLLRGLVLTAQFVPPEDRLLRALRSALGHTDPIVVESAVRALGRIGDEDDANAIANMVDFKGGVYRSAALGALAEVRGAKAVAHCMKLLEGDGMTPAERMAMIRDLRRRPDGIEIMTRLQSSDDPLVAAAAKLPWPPQPAGAPARTVLTLSNRDPLEAEFVALVGDTIEINNPVPGLASARIPFSQCDILDFPDASLAVSERKRLFLNQGSLVSSDTVALSDQGLTVGGTVFGELTMTRADVQGLALDPELDRLVGGSTDHDRVRLSSNEFLDGKILSVDAGEVRVKLLDETERTIPIADVAGMLMTRPRVVEPGVELFTRVDLTNGDRILGHVVAVSPVQIGIVSPELGSTIVPMSDVIHLELGVGGGALWGFTLIADYSDNRLVEVDEKGNETFVMEEVYGAWDVECLDNNNILITEFSVSRVQEMNRKGDVIWAFEDLKNPYDADRLANGNTLIADTFGGRVIEVNPAGEIVWAFDKEIRPFDVDRLPNGNTLISDVIKDRILEVSPDGEVVWEAGGLPNAHDADRLPNGNTLVTLRTLNKVVEINRDGEVVFEIGNLYSPSDADRLPNGHTLVAENGMVREFDRRGNEVWRKEMTWAVEVNRY